MTSYGGDVDLGEVDPSMNPMKMKLIRFNINNFIRINIVIINEYQLYLSKDNTC